MKKNGWIKDQKKHQDKKKHQYKEQERYMTIKSLLDSYACVPVRHLEPGGLCPGW